MNGSEFVRVDWAFFINRFSDDIHDSSKCSVADGNFDGIFCVNNRLSSDQSLGGVQRDGAYVVAAQMLSHLKDEAVISSLHLECIKNWREFTLKLYIDDGSNNLRDFAGSINTLREGPYTNYKRSDHVRTQLHEGEL